MVVKKLKAESQLKAWERSKLTLEEGLKRGLIFTFQWSIRQGTQTLALTSGTPP